MSKQSIAFGTLLLLASNILSRILGFARDALLARIGGTGIEVDAYNLAFLLPDLLNHFLGAGLLSVTLIPLLTPFYKNQDEAGANRVLNNVFASVFALILVLSSAAFLLAPYLIPLLSSQVLPPLLLEKATHFTRILIFAQVFFVAGGFFNAVQYCKYQYTFPALAPLFYNGGIILGGLTGFYTHSLDGFCWGVLGGSFVGNFALQWWSSSQNGLRLFIPKPLWNPDLKKYLWLTLPFVFGASAMFLSEFTYRYFGGAGEIAALGFGLRISLALVGVLAGAVGIASYPKMAEFCVQKNYADLNQMILNTIAKMFVILIPALCFTTLFAPELISVYLQGGAFGAQDSAKVAYYLQLYLLSVLPMTFLMMINRAFYANQQTWVPSIFSILCFLVFLPIYFIFEKDGGQRIPIIGAMILLSQAILLSWIWFKKHPSRTKIPYKDILITPIVSVLLASLSAWLYAQYNVHFPHQNPSKIMILTELCVFGGLGILFCFAILRILQVQPAVQLLGKFEKKLRAKA
jgi:putative peptidoglycan lipid II flippase